MSLSMVFSMNEKSNHYIKSTAQKIAKIKHALPCHENIAIVAFGDNIITQTNFTNDLKVIENSIQIFNMPIYKF